MVPWLIIVFPMTMAIWYLGMNLVTIDHRLYWGFPMKVGYDNGIFGDEFSIALTSLHVHCAAPATHFPQLISRAITLAVCSLDTAGCSHGSYGYGLQKQSTQEFNTQGNWDLNYKPTMIKSNWVSNLIIKQTINFIQESWVCTPWRTIDKG